MDWYRSWPDVIAPGCSDRPRVVDNLPRLLMRDFDYRTVGRWPKSAFVMVEWDIAYDWHIRTEFEKWIAHYTDTVAVVPYYLNGGRWIEDGFGMIYFPEWVARSLPRLAEKLDVPLTSGSFFKSLGGRANYTVCPYVVATHLNS